jgi:hypothetical protein
MTRRWLWKVPVFLSFPGWVALFLLTVRQGLVHGEFGPKGLVGVSLAFAFSVVVFAWLLAGDD